MKTIDARQKPCPQPVIMAQQALTSTPEGEEVVILVDNENARNNVTRYLNEQAQISSAETSNGDFHIRFIKSPLPAPKVSCNVGYADVVQLPGTRVIVLKQEWMGHGSEELGRLLIKGFLNALPESSPRPDAIICYNAGVNFATANSPVLEALQRLEIAGTKIWLCGTCVDYFGIRDQLQVGEITNMLNIIKLLNEAATVIYP